MHIAEAAQTAAGVEALQRGPALLKAYWAKNNRKLATGTEFAFLVGKETERRTAEMKILLITPCIEKYLLKPGEKPKAVSYTHLTLPTN